MTFHSLCLQNSTRLSNVSSSLKTFLQGRIRFSLPHARSALCPYHCRGTDQSLALPVSDISVCTWDWELLTWHTPSEPKHVGSISLCGIDLADREPYRRSLVPSEDLTSSGSTLISAIFSLDFPVTCIIWGLYKYPRGTLSPFEESSVKGLVIEMCERMWGTHKGSAIPWPRTVG